MSASARWAGVAETHVSAVFFAGDRAFKLLKPVRTPFLDYTTTERRREACRREVELNRRLAPDVYLGVSDLTEHGVVVDHLVVMRRLPDDRRLASILDCPDIEDCLREVARTVAAFHASETPSAVGAEVSTAAAVVARWDDNVRDMAPLVEEVLPADEFEAIERLAHRYVAGREALFRHRIESGYVRDGHGDLLADDIFCLDDGPRILDCLAFDDALRCGDVLNDIAFLVMDLQRLGYPRFARRLLEWYQEFSGEHHPGSLAHHYVAWRAHVRAKVACLRYGQGQPGAADEARALHTMTLDHLDRATVRLVVVGGRPGTGKSTLARRIGEACTWPVLASDELRRELTGLTHGEHAFAAPGEGIYREEVKEQVYDRLLEQAGELLRLGHSVVLDASWSSAGRRGAARRLAEETSSDLIELCCDAPADLAKERIVRRLATVWDPSDATPEVADHLASRFDEWPEATTVDTAGPIQGALDAALRTLRGDH